MLVFAGVLLAGLLVLVLRKEHDHDSEHFCGSCNPMGKKTFPDRARNAEMYNAGVLTEFSALQKDPNWQNMPWDNFFESEQR